jgi:hypothetical protein
MTEELNNLIKEDAKNIVDLLYETKALDSKLTRDNMNALEEYIRVVLQGRINNHINLIDLKSKLIEK